MQAGGPIFRNQEQFTGLDAGPQVRSDRVGLDHQPAMSSASRVTGHPVSHETALPDRFAP